MINSSAAPFDTPPDEPESGSTILQDRFWRMLLLSTLLHLAAALLMLGSGGGTGNSNLTPVINVSLTDQQLMPTIEQGELTEPKEVATESDEALPESETDPQTETETKSTPIVQQAPPASSMLFSITSGSFLSFKDGTTLRDDIRPYFLEMLERINTAWQIEGRGTKLNNAAILMVSVERDGKLLGVRILQSSGNPFHDRLLERAVSKTEFLPLPDTYPGSTFESPVRFAPPLSLMQFGSGLPTIPPH